MLERDKKIQKFIDELSSSVPRNIGLKAPTSISVFWLWLKNSFMFFLLFLLFLVPGWLLITEWGSLKPSQEIGRLFVTSIYFGVFLWFSFFLSRRIFNQGFLLEKGEVVIGRICDWNTFGGEKGGRRTGNDIIYYEFEYKDRLYKGKVWKFNYMPCYLQDEVVVLVNPQNTNQHIPFDDQNFFWELI